jgi:multidrug efflux pump subunit AcrA (membrane-fusion protein)
MEAQAKAQIALAQAQQSGNQTQLEIARLQLQAAQAGSTAPKSNTTLIIVGVVGGLAVLGTVIYFVTRKK